MITEPTCLKLLSRVGKGIISVINSRNISLQYNIQADVNSVPSKISLLYAQLFAKRHKNE
jgi:hypothetical protein